MSSWSGYRGHDPFMRRWAIVQRWKTRATYAAIFSALIFSGYALGAAAKLLTL